MTKSRMKFGALLAVMLIVGMALVPAVSALERDSGGKPVLDNKDPLSYDVQIYASNNNINTEEALHKFQLQDIAGKLDAELSTNEEEIFAGLWIERNPKFKIVVQFTHDGGETIKPYLKLHTELANVVEVRTAKVSLVDLRKAQTNASDSARASGVPVDSGINVHENRAELYVAKVNMSQFDNALQRKEIRLSDKVRVIPVEALAEPTSNIYGGLPLRTCTSGFSVTKGSWPFITKGITTAGHCSNSQSYNGNSLTFESEKVGGSYDIQWHTAPAYTVTNEIQWWSDGSTRDITATKSRSSQAIDDYVCKYGKTTGYGCGSISDKDYDPQYNWQFGDPSATFIRVDNTEGWSELSEPGDSGGPWFYNGDAYGIMSGQIDGGDAIYMAVDYVESGLGVSVMTSP